VKRYDNMIMIKMAIIIGRIPVLRRCGLLLQIELRGLSVGRSVCLSVTVLSHAKTAEPIEMRFGLRTRVGPKKRALGESAHWRHLEIPLNRPCAAAMRPYVKLLRALIIRPHRSIRTWGVPL